MVPADWLPPAMPDDAAFLRCRNAPAWRDNDPSIEARWVRHGHRIPLRSEKDRRGFHEKMPPRLDVQYVKHREVERDKGLREGYHVLPPTQDAAWLVAHGYKISPGFFVDKAEKKELGKPQWEALSVEEQIQFLRFVINQKRLNLGVRDKRCRMHGLKALPRQTQRGMHTHASTCDLKGAYRLIGVHPDDWKQMCCDLGPSVSGPRYILIIVLPFGYKLSPYVFSRIGKRPLSLIREVCPAVIWLDDLFFAHKGHQAGLEDQQKIDQILEDHYGLGSTLRLRYSSQYEMRGQISQSGGNSGAIQ
eukprot:COSAG01_NODE_888_length_12915_cov_10.708723_18_plen_304_part_00